MNKHLSPNDNKNEKNETASKRMSEGYGREYSIIETDAGEVNGMEMGTRTGTKRSNLVMREKSVVSTGLLMTITNWWCQTHGKKKKSETSLTWAHALHY